MFSTLRPLEGHHLRPLAADEVLERIEISDEQRGGVQIKAAAETLRPRPAQHDTMSIPISFVGCRDEMKWREEGMSFYLIRRL